MRCRKTCVGMAVFLLAGALGGCGGGGGGGGRARNIDVHATGRVVLASIGGGTLDVYRVGDYASPLLTVPTSTGATLPEIGRFAFDLAAVPEDALFLLVARGGQAFDTNENGILDSASTPNRGAVHALASAAELQTGEVHLSAVTEAVYQRARFFLSARYADAYVLKTASSWASFVVQVNLAGSPLVDNDDALAFDPRVHRDDLFRRYDEYGPMVLALLAGAPVTETAFDLSQEALATIPRPLQLSAVEVVGDLAYLCTGQELDVFDVSEPTAPILRGRFTTAGVPRRARVLGALAYVAEQTQGLEIVDVSTPASPTLVGALAVSNDAEDLQVVGRLAYVAGGGDRKLHVVDVSNPAAPAVVSDFAAASVVNCVAVEGTHAYLGENLQVETVDVTDPASPNSNGVVSTAFGPRVAVRSSRLFVAASRELDVFDLSAPAAPRAVATIPMPAQNVADLVVAGSRALVAGGFTGVCVVDLADPAAPSLVGTIPTQAGAASIALHGKVLVVPQTNLGLTLLAAGTPPPSGVIASLPVAEECLTVDARGPRVYVTTSQPDRFLVIDSTDPLAPTVLGSIPLGGSLARDMVVQGDLAFVAEDSLHVYDVSDATAPVFLGHDSATRLLECIAPDGNLVFGGAFDGLSVLDVTTPALPAVVTSVPVPGFPSDVAFDGSAIVLCRGTPGIETFDATTPTNLVPRGSLDMNDAGGVALRPPFAFVADSSSSGTDDALRVVDYSDLAAPVVVRSVPVLSGAARLKLDSDLVYAGTGSDSVDLFDVTVPTAALYVGTIPVATAVRDLDVEGGFLFVAGGLPTGGLLVLRAAQVAVP